MAVTRLVSSIAVDTPHPSLYYLDSYISPSLSSFFPFPYPFFNLFLPHTVDAHRLLQLRVSHPCFCNVKVLNTRAHLMHRYISVVNPLPSPQRARIFIFSRVFFRLSRFFFFFFLYFIYTTPRMNVEIHARCESPRSTSSTFDQSYEKFTTSALRLICSKIALFGFVTLLSIF